MLNIEKRNKRLKKFNGQTGGSIVELSIVGFIIAIAVVAAIPMIGQNLALYRTETSTRMITVRLLEAKLTAIKWNRTAWVEANPNDNSIEVRTLDNNGNAITTRLAARLPDEAAIQGGSTISVGFTSLGRKQSGAESIIPLNFPETGQCKHVKVSAAGIVSVVDCPQS